MGFKPVLFASKIRPNTGPVILIPKSEIRQAIGKRNLHITGYLLFGTLAGHRSLIKDDLTFLFLGPKHSLTVSMNDWAGVRRTSTYESYKISLFTYAKDKIEARGPKTDHPRCLDKD